MHTFTNHDLDFDYKTLAGDFLGAIKEINRKLNESKKDYLSPQELCEFLNIKESKMRKMVLTKKTQSKLTEIV